MPSLGRSNIVDWMCNIPGTPCQKSAPVVPTAAPERIHLAREVEEQKVGNGGCNGSGLVGAEASATTVAGCRLECAQRLEMQLANRDIQVAKDCAGYAWSDSKQQCLLYRGSADVTCLECSASWDCYALKVVQDSVSNQKASQPPPAAKPGKVNLDVAAMLQQGGQQGGPQAATAIRTLVDPASDSGCFDGIAW